jgi:hypothetical protein
MSDAHGCQSDMPFMFTFLLLSFQFVPSALSTLHAAPLSFTPGFWRSVLSSRLRVSGRSRNVRHAHENRMAVDRLSIFPKVTVFHKLSFGRETSLPYLSDANATIGKSFHWPAISLTKQSK